MFAGLVVWPLVPATLLHLVQATSLRPIHYAALGDSYAAGDGAGSSKLVPHFGIGCGRFSAAYPYQILNDPELTFSSWWPNFENHACGGATTKSVKWKQSRLIRNKDFVTIQVGGNEVDFFPILNECIQQWHPLSSCSRELERAQSLIESTEFMESFDSMLSILTKYSVRRETLVFVLGYAKFFNDDTDQCNNVTFSLTNPANILSKELRHSFNTLVMMLNNVIRASAEAHGAIYIDIDQVFEGHRFCEEGVSEPRPDWEGTWFFREASQCSKGMSNDVDRWSEMRGESQTSLHSLNPFKRFADLTRAFHPTIEGHAAIAQKIVGMFKQQSQGRAD